MASFNDDANGHTTSSPGRVAGAPSQAAPNGPSLAALLMNPKAHKAHLSNGNPSFTTPHEMDPPSICSDSETGVSSSSEPNLLDSPAFTSKDDAHDSLKGQGRGTKNSKTQAMPQPRQSFDPRQLLDPKGAASPQRGPSPKQQSGSSPSSNGSHKRPSEEPEAPGMGNFIERVHGITQREERPHKRIKTDNQSEADEEEKKATFAGGGKGGDIGEYMREKRKEAQAKDGPQMNVVDLTEGDDNDVVVVGESEVLDKEVCYGVLSSAKVQAHMIPNPSNKQSYYGRSHWPAMKVQLRRHPGKDNIIRVEDPTGKDFGNVDVHTSIGLARLMDFANWKPRFRVQARLHGRPRSEKEVPYTPCSAYLTMHINLYGPKSRGPAVGTNLGRCNIWLQTPYTSDAGIEICNPHAKEPPKAKAATSTSSSSREPGYVYRTTEEVRSEVLSMFDSLEKSENMPELEADSRITTALLQHQKQGLWFMTEKEKERVFSDTEEDNNSLWRLKIHANNRRTYYNVITGREERNKPKEALGGILADMMGLGKTLSILSLVVGSLDQRPAWVQQTPPPPEDGDIALVQNAKTTLLIAPLSTMANWEEQIRAHIQPDTLKYHLYHGPNRTTDLKELSKYDMIITTYSIISSEYNRRSRKREVSPLFQLNFFRIVLDEAHMIREQSTMQSQAVCKLCAQRRWAVTGTPVQNRLDDLGALIKFLRIEPFEKQGFAQHILTPFKNADPEILPKLRLLVDSVTLRRLKDKIDLPPRHDILARLRFNEDEALLYDWFMRDSKAKAKAITGDGGKEKLGGKSYVHILRAILRLRLICAHGRELLSEDDLKMTEGFNASNAIDLSDEDDESEIPVMSDRQAYEMLMLFKETDVDTCAQCARKIGNKDDDGTPSPREGVIGYMLPCFQLVCRDCYKDIKQVIDSRTGSGGRFTCPLCEQHQRGIAFELTQDGIDAAEDAKALARDNPRHSKIMGRYGGPHTKTKALVAALLASQEESQPLLEAGEPPIKSVVFSGWTTHLDLIQIALANAGLSYVRLDGKMTRQKRNASLDAFRDDPGTTIILISIMAGGLGLNLTTGSKVYVMEPQFNPAAEAQAVDRVHRLGQKREVTCTRYIMEDSFEENMLKLQAKKQNLADLSMNRGKLDKAEAAKQRLEELRSLFK